MSRNDADLADLICRGADGTSGVASIRVFASLQRMRSAQDANRRGFVRFLATRRPLTNRRIADRVVAGSFRRAGECGSVRRRAALESVEIELGTN